MNWTKIFEKIQPRIFLDIGANEGNFTSTLLKFFPDCKCLMVEPNPACRPYLVSIGQPFEIVAVSDSNGRGLLHIENSNPLATGASLYKENTQFYAPGKFHQAEVQLITLDSLNPFPNTEIDLIKIDTQGSELDILKNGKITIQRTKFLLLEVSLLEYNLNAPLIDEVLDWTSSHNFNLCEIVNYHRLDNNQIFQLDVLLMRSSN
jgi:FkbM family methyltransferase